MIYLDNAILAYLQTGAVLTPALAADKFRCLALHSACSRLREKGHNITCTMRSGNGRRWGEYSLPAAQASDTPKRVVSGCASVASRSDAAAPITNPASNGNSVVLVTCYYKDKNGKERSYQVAV